MKLIHQQEIETAPAQRVWNVSDFCRRFRLDAAEEKRLRLLLGEFANQQELLMNAERKPDLR
ncbi:MULTISPECIES: hypothetical protein [unclassified Rhizobium]|uniref:hypothetical protein n=1 Tax=unclassified Rhizobium TaxID=2613769 RepID=UPI0006FB7EC9|nr:MULTISPECIES: hypothetical protein [unclassified Rhizobium]KQV34626.1 hypothetical protein ASC86_13935 [Rhizobium sp. Root1212]KRD23960.1 hypothetical protein ASE37_13930 [Rhizobium sp. Root268]